MSKEIEKRDMEASWPHLLLERILHLWWLKMAGTLLVTSGFFLAYFWVLRHPQSQPFVMPLTVVDNWIGFASWAVTLYFSLWLYVGLLPALYDSCRDLLVYLGGVLSLSLSGFMIFYHWPTSVQIPDSGQRSKYLVFLVLDGVDSAGNACPSLHVAFAVFTAIGLRSVLKKVRVGWGGQFANLLWCGGICYSTIAVRQHVFLDLVAGAGLGTLMAAPTFSLMTTNGKNLREVEGKVPAVVPPA